MERTLHLLSKTQKKLLTDMLERCITQTHCQVIDSMAKGEKERESYLRSQLAEQKVVKSVVVRGLEEWK